MKRLPLVGLFMLIMLGGAYAHEGALSLYTTIEINDCDWELGSGQPFDKLNLYYVKGDGPDMGAAFEFKLEPSVSAGLSWFEPTWASQVEIVLGNLTEGYSGTATACIGVGESVVFIGNFAFLNMTVEGPFNVKIIPHPVSGKILITLCELNDPKHEVLGGTFIFNGTCNYGAQESSWGAIKSIYGD